MHSRRLLFTVASGSVLPYHGTETRHKFIIGRKHEQVLKQGATLLWSGNQRAPLPLSAIAIWGTSPYLVGAQPQPNLETKPNFHFRLPNLDQYDLSLFLRPPNVSFFTYQNEFYFCPIRTPIARSERQTSPGQPRKDQPRN